MDQDVMLLMVMGWLLWIAVIIPGTLIFNLLRMVRGERFFVALWNSFKFIFITGIMVVVPTVLVYMKII